MKNWGFGKKERKGFDGKNSGLRKERLNDMEKAFLTELKTCYNLIVSDEEKMYSSEALSTIKKLDNFLLSGVLTKSNMEKFILENYKLGVSEITKKWNLTHRPEKKENTFRGQYSLLGSYIGSLFNISAGELNNIFVSNNLEAFRGIHDLIDSFSVGNLDFSKRFPYLVEDLNLMEYSNNPQVTKDYDFKDCINEIKFLKTLDITNIRRLAEDINIDKLSYLLKVSSEPLVTDSYVEQINCKKKVKRPQINQNKLAFCRIFKDVDEVNLKRFRGTPSPKVETSNVPKAVSAVEGVSIAEKANVVEKASIVEGASIEEKANVVEGADKSSDLSSQGVSSQEVISQSPPSEVIPNSSSQEDISQSQGVSTQEVISQPSATKYNLDLPEPYLERLLSGLDRFNSLPDDVRSKYINAVNDNDMYLKQCRQFLGYFTLDGFFKAVNKLNPYALGKVLKEFEGQ